MKKIGIIGGMSWESSLEYYRQINRLVQERIGGLSSASCIMDSVDFGPIADLMEAENWDAISAILGNSAQSLAGAGAEIIVVATNTMHLLYEEISARAGVPVIHIADATGDAVRDARVTKLALLGTKFTMEKPFYAERLSTRYGVQVLTPPAETRLELNRIIFEELCRGEFNRSSTKQILEMIVDLTEQGAEGVALACTELPLVIGQDEVAIPIFDTLSLHCRAVVNAALS
ncbi:MAG TPA: aspartate/glutamate racemase family protein [Spirochaetia bacterium]|nr:aspartate/glutamate racemase family protein [Spirochaetia bacterium]